MEHKVNIEDVWGEAKFEVVLDVRSPAEFEKGHIPGAINFPLFSNLERAEIGTIYKQESAKKAMHRGLEIVAPKMAKFVESATEILGDKKTLIHCWRGGKRSSSMSWLLNMSGHNTHILTGGYKAYRKFVREQFKNIDLDLIVLSGKTGTGKTKILHELTKRGEQVIDLEFLANHKGSAFGWIGEKKQPSVEHFENLLFANIQNLDLNRTIWIENESRSIGSVYLPDGFWEKLKSSKVLNIEVPDKARIKNLVDIYSSDNKEELKVSFNKIKKRLGGLNFNLALEALEKNELEEAAKIALYYYDKSYNFLLRENAAPEILIKKFDTGSVDKICDELITLTKNKIIEINA